MVLHYERFKREYYQEYAAWFADPELSCRLGPMDEDWLTAVLSQKAEDGITWAVFSDKKLVSVVEIVFDKRPASQAAITAIAVKPSRRRQGLARAILQQLLEDHHRKGILRHLVYVHHTNEAAQNLFKGLGFAPVSEPDEHGFIEFRHER